MRAGILAICSTAALALSAMPAFSADMVDTCPSTWTGVYAGLHAGYAFGDANTDAGDPSIDGFVGGALGGWNFETCSFVAGLEGDFGFSPGDIDGSSGTINDLDVEPNGHIRGRLGLDMDGAWMPFVAAGLALADADVTGGGSSGSKLHLGFTIGAGVDYRITDNIIGRVEYLFDTYESKNYNGPAGSVDFDTHTIRAAVIWQF